MRKSKTAQMLTALILSLMMIVSTTPISAAVETDAPPVSSGGEITGFETLAEDISSQYVPVGTELSDLTLPEQLSATVNDEETNIAVLWQAAPEYNAESDGEYIFTPVLPEGYTLAEGVSPPGITVTVEMLLFSARSGTAADYSWYDAEEWEFEIGTEAQLQGLADIVNGNYGEAAANFWGKTITLTADLDLSAYENWTPIGISPEKPFFGTFEGGKHTISNLTINAPEAYYIGLFGMVKGTVKDVILMDPDIAGLENVGGIAGEIWNNVLNHCAVVGGQVAGHKNVGGVVGRVAYDPTIINTPSNESRIERCFATCDVVGTGTWPEYAGGVAGIVEYGNVLNCYATGSVRSSDGIGSYNRFYSVGGVVGRGYCASIVGCYAMGDVVATLSIGGIVGTMGGVGSRQSRLENCIALNGMVAGNLDWYGGPKTGRVVGEHSYTGIINIWASKTMARVGDGGSHGPDITPEELQTQEKFISNGFPEPAWIGGVGKLAILADFPEGLQSADIPWYLISSAPSAPRNLTAVNGDQTVTLNWLAPAYDGASAVSGYEVRKNSEAWISAGMSTSYTFTGLTNDTTYTFAVRAVNDSGEGREVTLEKTPGTPPGAVQNPIVVYEGNSLILYWEKPAGTVNEDAVYYQTRYWYDIPMWEDKTWDSVDYRSYSRGYTNISGNVTYTLQIRAGNAHGLGPVTEISGSRDSYPTPPKTVTAAAGNGQVTLNWSAPSYQGTSAITSYQVFHPVSKTWVSAGMATSYTVTGLTNGVSYRFFVRAMNSGGNGTSATLVSTPFGPPTITSGNSYALTYGAGGSFQVQATSAASLTFSLTGAPSGVTIDSAGLISISKTIGAGSYPFTVTVSNGALPDTTQSFTLTINKANSTLSISCANITYGASPVPSVVSNISGGAVTYQYKVQEANDSTYTATVPTAAGSYTVRGTSAATTNYNAATATANFTIGKADNTLSISCTDISYGASPAPSAGTNVSGGAVTYQYKVRGADDSSYTATIPARTGDYTVRGTSAATANYNAATATADFSIYKAAPPLTLTADPTGTRSRPGSVLLSAVLPADATGTLAFKSGTDTIGTVTLPDKTASFTPSGPVNDYSFTVEYSGDSNYNSKSSTALEYGFTKSEQADIAVLDGTVNYGDTLDVSSLAGGGSGSGAFSFAVDSGPGELSDAILSPTGAGEVTITVAKAADDDYNTKTATFKVTVDPRVISFTVASVETQTYTGSPLTPEPEVRDGTVVLKKDVDFTYAYSNNTDSGTAEITVTGIGNYAGSTGSAEFSIHRSSGSTAGDSQDTAVSQAETPTQPTSVSVSATAQVTNGSASLTVAGSTIQAAIDKALADAKANDTTANGISVDISVAAPGATEFTLTLEQRALDHLLDAGVKSAGISNLPVSMSFNTEALSQICTQSGGNVVITVKPAAVPGLRNAFSITIGSAADGTAGNISSLGTGACSLSIPAELGENEFGGYLYGVYVGADGQISRIADSVYDANSGCIIFSTNHFSTYGVGYTAPAAKFTDIGAHWGKEGINYVVGRGLFSGTSETTFAPNTAMTRGMLVAALGRLAGIDVKLYTTSSFSDVNAGSVFSPYIEWAYKNGIIQGTDTRQFAPNRAITREEIARIIQNYAKATGYPLPAVHSALAFADAPAIGTLYEDSVNALQMAGIMMGDQNNRFNPKANATRAEVSAMLQRCIKLTIDPVTARGWALNNAGQYLYYKDGKALTGTQTIGGTRYFFETTGALKIGWVKDGNAWRFYSGNRMVTGWREIGANGSNKSYYFDQNGSMVSGKWIQIDGKWYYFYVDGSLAKGTKVDGYEVDKNGARKTR